MMFAGLAASMMVSVKTLSTLFFRQVTPFPLIIFFSNILKVVPCPSNNGCHRIIHQKLASKEWPSPSQSHCRMDNTWYTVIKYVKEMTNAILTSCLQCSSILLSL